MPEPVISPGTYIRKRREAAGKSLVDVAVRLPTDPAWPEHQRTEWLRLIEADAAPLGFSTVVALAAAFPLDMGVLARLDAVRQGLSDTPPHICRDCACSNYDGCVGPFGRVCHWIERDLCSACDLRTIVDQVDAIHAAAAAGLAAR
ncbi:hypothetical protein SAMN05192583_1019 [Sphingomonas gellani]|uniref:Uncharacterized protein n=1 Tax=Sphingomonas gellani TaxID=1166340 RepID=A0A1H8AR43_9SPHN|nr:XRE family transcriptional regulator [Sphingomonas gellani]SEM72986.1 hypothetical protein SAMN05192583_1019 [Sphingomonas gellani]